jgi:3'-phosphoadenosine 5'-phosphosulfate sulfotransferase (PAPS reductase)/FAD synthetase
MERIVMYSGGLGSWAAADRVIARHGVNDVTLLFCDTLIEDADLYRFLDETAADFGVPITRLVDGRTPWQVFRDERFLGNSRVDPCSRVLKRQISDRWLKDNCEPSETVVYVGIDWTEEHRFDDKSGGGLRPRRAADGWTYEAPLCEHPLFQKEDAFLRLRSRGIKFPRLYAQGFAHNNCGGWCIKGGHAAYALLWRTNPALYLKNEAEEESLRELLGDVSMMTDRSGDGKKKPLTMRAFRERIASDGQYDLFDIGGCGCFVSEGSEP